MALEQRLIQTQKLILSPQLRQYLRLLQLPLLELKQAIEQELAENPVLEEALPASSNEVPLSAISKEEPSRVDEERTQELNFQNKLNELNRIDQEFKETFYSDIEQSDDETKESIKKKNYQESIISKSPTLADYLLWQMGLLDFDAKETQIAQELIGNVDEDGYLQIDLGEVSQNLQVPMATVEKVLKELQTLDPPGVCARNLSEALLIQLEKINPDAELAKKILQDCFTLLEKKHFSEIAKRLNVREEGVREAFNQISQLEPKPGRMFYSNAPVTMVPDATIYEDDENPGNYKTEIHQESVPRLKISPSYRRMLKDKKLDRDTKIFLKNKMNSAMWLMQAIGQRKNTLRAITEEIVKSQNEFFERGFAYLKPLRLKDIAEKVGLHESTVSRAIAGKYVVTQQGTIPYRSFFSNKMETEDGPPESQKSITEQVKKIIEREDKKKPLSDEKILVLLKAEGIKIARRTVAKYREMLKILPTHLRKER